MTEQAKIPVWFLVLLWGTMGSVIGGGFIGGIAYGKAQTDVANLQDRVGKLESLPDTVSAMKADLQTVKEQQAEIRSDIKTLLSRSR